MKRIAVVYWSGTGNTEAMAKAVAEGAGKAGAAAELFAVADFNLSTAATYDAFALGCPAMGAEALEEDEFDPFYQSLKPTLSGRKLALFGSYGWGDGEWMRSWQDDAVLTGASLAAEPVICNETPGPDDLAACAGLGAALA